MKDRSMFPFRRSNKKRGKGGSNGRRQREGGSAPKRNANSPQELLPALQPTTKALAQMLAGNTRASGQLVHARNVLAQAQHMIDERQVERIGPAQREEFYEQVARLKLTVADADAAIQDAEDDDVEEEQLVVEPTPAVSRERLRELALSLATVTPRAAIVAETSRVDDDVEAVEEPAPVVEAKPVYAVVEEIHAASRSGAAGSPRHSRLSLRPLPSKTPNAD